MILKTRYWVFTACCMAVPFAGITPSFAALLPGLSVSQLQLVGSRRVGRTIFEYDYRVTVTNDDGAVSDVVGTLSSGDPDVEILDSTTSFDLVGTQQTASSDDTVTVRFDRRATSFDQTLLVWTFDGQVEATTGLPSDPGEDGLATIRGIDADDDGVRDDVQRLILALDLEFEETQAMTQAAIADQEALLFGAGLSSKTLQEVGNQSARAGDCLWDTFGLDADIQGSKLTLVTINTPERSEAMQQFAEQSIGALYARNESGEACE